MLVSGIQCCNSASSRGKSLISKNSVESPVALPPDSFTGSKQKNIAFKGLLGDFAKITGLGVVAVVAGAVAAPIVGAAVLAGGAAKLLLDDDSTSGGSGSGSGSSSSGDD